MTTLTHAMEVNQANSSPQPLRIRRTTIIITQGIRFAQAVSPRNTWEHLCDEFVTSTRPPRSIDTSFTPSPTATSTGSQIRTAVTLCQGYPCHRCFREKYRSLKDDALRSDQTRGVHRSTPLVLAVQQGHVGAASALIEAGAAIDVVPRREDGSEKASSLTRLAADMKRGDMVSLLAKAVVQRDSSDAWVKEWAAANGTVAGAAASAPDLGGGGADGAGGVDSAGGVDNGEDTADCVESIDGVDNAAGVDIAGGVDRAADGDGASGVDGAGGADGAPGANGSTGVSSIGVTFRPRR